MKNILLVRHGESIQNTGENRTLMLPDHEVCLIEKGEKQASDAGRFLKIWTTQQNLDPKDTLEGGLRNVFR